MKYPKESSGGPYADTQNSENGHIFKKNTKSPQIQRKKTPPATHTPHIYTPLANALKYRNHTGAPYQKKGRHIQNGSRPSRHDPYYTCIIRFMAYAPLSPKSVLDTRQNPTGRRPSCERIQVRESYRRAVPKKKTEPDCALRLTKSTIYRSACSLQKAKQFPKPTPYTQCPNQYKDAYRCWPLSGTASWHTYHVKTGMDVCSHDVFGCAAYKSEAVTDRKGSYVHILHILQ